MDPLTSLNEALLALELKQQEQKAELDRTEQEILRVKKAIRVMTTDGRLRKAPSDTNRRVRVGQLSRERVLAELKATSTPILTRELAKRIPEYTSATIAGALSTLKREGLVGWDGYDTTHNANLWVAL